MWVDFSFSFSRKFSGKSTTGYQRALAIKEFEQLLTYVAELEQLLQPTVSGQSEQLFCECERNNPYTGVKFDSSNQFKTIQWQIKQ